MLNIPTNISKKRPPSDKINQVIGLFQKGELQAALSQGQQLIEDYPDTASIHNVLGVCLSHEGQTKQSLYHFKEALKLDPSNPMIYTIWEIYFLIFNSTKKLKSSSHMQLRKNQILPKLIITLAIL